MQAELLHERLESIANQSLKKHVGDREWSTRRTMQGDMAVLNIDFKNPDFTTNFGVGVDEADQLDGRDEDGVCPLDEVIALRVEDAIEDWRENC